MTYGCCLVMLRGWITIQAHVVGVCVYVCMFAVSQWTCLTRAFGEGLSAKPTHIIIIIISCIHEAKWLKIAPQSWQNLFSSSPSCFFSSFLLVSIIINNNNNNINCCNSVAWCPPSFCRFGHASMLLLVPVWAWQSYMSSCAGGSFHHLSSISFSLVCLFFFSFAVQHECIPQAILGMDIICQAKSGMGKTAVFVLSTLHLLEPNDNEGPHVIVSSLYPPPSLPSLPLTPLLLSPPSGHWSHPWISLPNLQGICSFR